MEAHRSYGPAIDAHRARDCPRRSDRNACDGVARDARNIGASGASAVAIVERLESLVSRSRTGPSMQLNADGVLICHQLRSSKSLGTWMAAEFLFD
jgi:hypothetical protein